MLPSHIQPRVSRDTSCNVWTTGNLSILCIFEMMSRYSSNGWKNKKQWNNYPFHNGFCQYLSRGLFLLFSRCSTLIWLRLQYTKNLTHWPRWVVQETCRRGSVLSQWKVFCFIDPPDRFTLCRTNWKELILMQPLHCQSPRQVMPTGDTNPKPAFTNCFRWQQRWGNMYSRRHCNMST